MVTLLPAYFFIQYPQLKSQITLVNTDEAYKTVSKVIEIQLYPILPLWFQGILQANTLGFLYFFWVPS